MSDDDDDMIVRTMKRTGTPVTRQNWINLSYGADIPNPWTWEHEEELPPGLRIPWQDGMDLPPQPGRPGPKATS